MIGKILQAARRKQCTCDTGRKCPACKSKLTIRPHVIVEEPRRLPAQVSITFFNQTPQTVQFAKNPLRWRFKKQQTYETPPKKPTFICQWYRRRKALKQLKLEYKKEKEALKQRRREQYERERLRDFIYYEHKRRHAKSKPEPVKIIYEAPSPVKPKPVKAPTPVQPTPVKVTKHAKKIKEKSAYVKPKGKSKSIAVKRTSRRDTISARFVNYCYRICCQFYCYLTCILIIAVTIFFIV